MNKREYELTTLINSLQYDAVKLKEQLESKYHEGYMDGKAFKDRHITMRDHFAGLAMQGLLASPVMGDCALHNSSVDWLKDITKCSYDFADFMMVYREKRDD